MFISCRNCKQEHKYENIENWVFSEALIETSSIALASAINIVRGDEGGV